MKNISDFSRIKLGDITGALGHHEYFVSNAVVAGGIKDAAVFIKQYGLNAYIDREYPNARNRSKNIILNNIAGKLYITDGNRHAVSIVIADKNITIGKLLKIEPYLFRYWEEGYEEGGDTAYQPYVTYIPYNINVSRIRDAKQGTDDKNQRINIIPSDIPYDSEVFDVRDRGRAVIDTARAISKM